ncbi:MAG TPA: cell surface protein SprA [Ignavibacteriaceae bacterium]|nr:cell surface protein SprA [Ignavibacteriaceae bacterium]
MADSLSDRRMDSLAKAFSTDTSYKSSDSTRKFTRDTTKVDSMALDSTARIKYFHYKRVDVPYVQLKLKRLSPFYAPVTNKARSRKVEIDSTGKYVEIKEMIGDEETKILLRMPIEDYINASLAYRQRETWEDLGYTYELKEGKKGLGELIKDITDFEIPLPSVGVLSIFGDPKISLKIGGAVDIHGAWRSETTEGVTASRLGNTRNEPDFKQQVQINVSGTIGDKLNINADWNTERTFEYENQLKIKYTGYEDEIIQSIEAGNVSLETSPLVGGSEALFGVKALFKMGPFSLTALASQKKGEIKEVSVNSGSTSQTFEKRAYEYSINHYFIDQDYASEDLYNTFYASGGVTVTDSLHIKDLEVWKSINVSGKNPQRERNANAYIDLDPLTSNNAQYDSIKWRKNIAGGDGLSETGRFLLLTENDDYTYNEYTGVISFKTQINEQDIIAVAYRREFLPGADNDKFFGEFLATAKSDSQKLVLKLVKPANLQPRWAKAWNLLLKNIYPVGGRNIKKDGFEFRIQREIPGQDPVEELPKDPNQGGGSVKLLEAFGLDRYNSSDQATPDNIFDWKSGVTVIQETGEIIFPTLHPFGNNIPPVFANKDSLRFDDVYDTTTIGAQSQKTKDRWVLVGKYSGEASNVYQLGFNIVENSVKVTLNGRLLSAGTDYVVDYTIGQLTIRNDAALVPGADLKITYEQNDLFQLASKTLLGARGLFNFSERTKLGFSILNLNQQTLSDKVRIGEEPLSNTIYGVDFTTGVDLPFVTKGLDKLISTKQMSSLTLNGEYAYIDPDPNTKKSTIASDNNKSIAYIDDFEGAKRIIPIGVSYTGWKDLSPPFNLPTLPGVLPADMMPHKGKSFWYSATPSGVVVQQIWGDRKRVAREDQDVPVMDYNFWPDTPGTFNYAPNLNARNENWGGVMKLLSSTANNLVEENVEFIEFWLNVADAPSDAKLYIDLGRISEDVIPNDSLDTEDKDGNDVMDLEGKEDVGIDGLTDEQERIRYPNAPNRADPSGDNFAFAGGSSLSPEAYFNINGTQGNAHLTDIGRFPDTEDLNRNGNISLVNNFFRYVVPLNPVNNPFIVGGGDQPADKPKWYLFRIPLKDTTTKVGDPSLSNVETIRMFMTNVNSRIHLRFAEFNLVGNQWEKVLKQDTTMAVSVISYEDNPDYHIPPGVSQEKDRTNPNEEVFRNEQALNLIITDLKDGEHREAVKYLYKPLDVFNYSEMKLFVHGDKNTMPGSISYYDSAKNFYSAEVYFRFGIDTNNYYEYRQPVRFNPDPSSFGWDEISIEFSKLTALKQIRDTLNIISQGVEGKPNHFYRIKGNPSLTQVKFLMVGIYNPDNPDKPYTRGGVSGEIWVNELRVVGADDSPGWAYSVSTQMKLADLMTVNFNMSQTNPYFHRLSDRFGTRVESKNWNTAVDFDVLKLIPANMSGSNLKLNYSHTESIGKPLYLPGTDIRVDQAAERLREDTSRTKRKTADQIISESQTVNISDSWSSSNIKIKIPSNYWLIRDTWNSLAFGFNYNNSFSRNPTIMSTKSWVWNATMNYNLTFSPDYFFYPADVPVLGSVVSLFSDYKNAKVYFTPQSFQFNASASRNRTRSISRALSNTTSLESVNRDFTTRRGFNFAWKITEGGFLNLSTSYNVNIQSSLAYLESDKINGIDLQRSERDIWRDIFSGAFFGKDYNYQQNVDLRTSPKLPSLWNLNKFFTLTSGYSVGYQWTNDFRQEVLGRSAGYGSKSSVGLTVRLKSLFQPLFSEPPEEKNTQQQQQQQTTGNRRGRDIRQESPENKIQVQDTIPAVKKDTLNSEDTTKVLVKRKAPLKNAVLFLSTFAKTLLFDYETISINFTNDNSLSKSGVLGKGTGFNNFWGLSFNQDRGPSRSFMFGLGSNVGRRAPGNLQDAFSQKNNLDFKTSRPLWSGAKIDLNWSVGWSINKTTTLKVDDDGSMFISNVASTGSIDRSFLSLPPFLFLSVFKSGIKQVKDLYNPDAPNKNENLSDAFIRGFESFPLLSKLSFLKNYSKYIPRPNWNISWDGLESFFLFKAFAKRVSLSHSYVSNYSEGWKINPDGKKEISTQRIDYGFAPLFGLNFGFGEVWGGNLTSTLKYSTKTTYDLTKSTQKITETYSRDIGITAGYSKSGFELPLFGISLKNDIEFSFSYSSTQNSTIIFDMNDFREEGTPQDGNTRTTMEPRIKYTISSKVTLSIFYRRSSVEPEGAARIPPTTTNEAGLDVHISIQ